MLKHITHIVGVDFTSAPRRAKPITVAHGSACGNELHIERVDSHPTWASWEDWLAQPGPWIGAFDFPFGLHPGDPQRIALEGYPGMVARAVTRASYKNDERAKQTPARQAARVAIVKSLENGAHPLGIRLVMDATLRQQLVDDGTADWLDAVLCAVAATWAAQRPNFGLPIAIDPVEGWTAGAAHG